MANFRGLFSRAIGLVAPAQTVTLAGLIDAESKIGGKLFGATGRGVTRRFFLDEGDSWFFDESAVDPTTGRQLYHFTIRYEILPQGILKSVDGKGHVFITGVELAHLKQAIKLYNQRTKAELYTAKQSESTRSITA